MQLRKIAMGDRLVMKKYRIQASSAVSYWHDEFDGDGHTSVITYGNKKPVPAYGVSKMEWAVSGNAFETNGWTSKVNGG